MNFLRDKKLCEYLLLILLVISLIGLIILCFISSTKIQGIRVGISIFCAVVLFAFILIRYSNVLFSSILKWLHQKKECLIKKAYKICTCIGERLKAKLVVSQRINLLSPKILEESKYVDVLKSAIDEKGVYNIALTGPYGSGKSSIIKTFLHLYPKYKCLNLSLASFAEEQEQPSTVTVTEKEGDNPVKTTKTIQNKETKIDVDKLEYSLVQQFFYHVKACRIPESRFGRILRISRASKIIIVSCIVIALLSISVLCMPEQLKTIFTFLSYNNNLKIATYLSGIALASILIWALYKVIGYIPNLNSGHIKLMNYEIELQKDMNISIFNRYLDELIYLFQRTGYELVVLEDLDRFENTSIFTKLRELNLLLNQSKDIGHRIVFVYALRDDVFKTACERTKFFDYIIPIIPHVNVSNSASFFVDAFKDLIRKDKKEQGLDKSFLADVAPFVGDFRTLKAIVSEFSVNRFLLDKKLELNNLLAIIIYKNLNPQDFEKIYDGKGTIKEIFDKKTTLIEDEQGRIQKEISNLGNIIRVSENENLRSIEELRALVLAAVARCIPNGYGLCDNNSKYMSFNYINTDERIKSLLQGGCRVRNVEYYSNTPILKDQVLTALGPDFDYDKRKKQIEQKTDAINRRLRTQREKLQKQLDELLQKSVSELCKDNPYLLKESGLCKDNTLLEFLIRKGYIDEKYFYYITVFKEGILSSEDNDYLMEIKSLGASDKDEFGRHIDSPNSLLLYLNLPDFKSDKILNFELAHAIMMGENKDYKKWLIEKLKEGGALNLDFISRYAFTDFVDDGLLKSISAGYPDLWMDIAAETLFSDEARLNLFTMLMRFAETSDIVKMNSDGQMEKYLSSQNYADVFKDISADKAKGIIDALHPYFYELIDDRRSTSLLEFVYEEGYYDLNKFNVLLILNIYGKIDVSKYDGAVYSAIKDSEIPILNEQIEGHIDHFVKAVVLASDNIKEQEGSFILLLNNENLSSETKQSLILHNTTKIDAVENVTDPDILHQLYDDNKVKASFAKMIYYYQVSNLSEPDDTLCKFINTNGESFKQELVEEHKAEDLSFIKSVLFAPEIKEGIAKAILDDQKYKILWIDEISNLKESLVVYLIDRKSIDFSVERFKNIGSAYNNLYGQLLKQYAKEVTDHLEEFAFSTDNLLIILNWPEYLTYKQRIVGAINENSLTTATQANKLLDYYLSSDSVLEENLYYKALELSDNPLKKMSASVKFINRNMLSAADYNRYFSLMGDGFESLCSPGETFIIEKSPEAETFINLLDSKDILGHRSDTKTEFKAYVKKV
jgi:hypothetical protein